MRRAALALALGLGLAAAGAHGEEAPGPGAPPAPGGDAGAALARALEDLGQALPESFGPNFQAFEAYQSLQAGQSIRARELAERLLAEDPGSFEGHCLLGLILHQAEGNLPRALHHLARARRLFEARYGARPAPGAPWFWHLSALHGLARVSGEMGRDAEKLAHLAERDALYRPARPADRGWPLMRLGRYAAARDAALEGLALGDPDQGQTARIALCVVAAERLDREGAYRACLEAAREHGAPADGDPVLWTNAAEAALGLLRLDEAERLNLEASRRFAAAFTNPWANLLQLYLAEGRTAEAEGALRRMLDWRDRQPAYVHAQTWAGTDLAAATFLAVAGHAREAARITARALDRPDRYGASSDEARQREAGAALLDRIVHRELVERELEEASWSAPREAWLARARAARSWLRAWSSGRRAAALLAEERILESTLRPYLVDTVVLPEWLQPELVSAVGPGVAAAALARARASETLAGASGYFEAFELELAWLRGRPAAAREHAAAALRELPEAEVLLRTRSALRAAQAALAQGERGPALELLGLVLQRDPGAVRRLGAALPCRFEIGAGPLALRAGELLRRSPRLAEIGAGFRVRVESRGETGSACLLGPDGALHACARVAPRAGEDEEARARRLARELHQRAFAPRIELTQADLASLDGAPTASGRGGEAVGLVLSELLAPRDPAEAAPRQASDPDSGVRE